MSKQYSVRELRKMLVKSGFVCKRTNGSHAIYSNVEVIIPLPVVSLNYKVGDKIARQLSSAT